MNLLQTLIGAGLRQHVRRKARGKSLAQVRAGLESSLSEVLLPRIERVEGTAANRETLNHWLGIERWSLARVRSALGEPFVEGSYRPYRLGDDASWSQLKAGFIGARRSTVALALSLERSGFDPERTVRHNHLGPLTITEWFTYIDDHSRREVIRLR